MGLEGTAGVEVEVDEAEEDAAGVAYTTRT